MKELVGEWQSSFIPGRQTIDNVVIASLNKKKGNKGSMVIMIDLEKAYDPINWGYLSEILRMMGFEHKLMSIIMSSLTSSILSVIWNGSKTQRVVPERGLNKEIHYHPTLSLSLYYAWKR